MFFDLISKRYSVRNFKTDQILVAGQVAPTGANMQPQRLIIVRERTGLEN